MWSLVSTILFPMITFQIISCSKRPFFENPREPFETETEIPGNPADKSKEIDGRRPIDEDRTIRKLIYPGTKWCGQGNVATHYGDLGLYEKTDMCCRDHDYCPDYISAGKTKYGLKNTAPYTKVHCDCDAKFKMCLENDNTDASNDVGHLYFNLFGSQCFKKDYPIIQCRRYSQDPPRRCLEYDLDETRDKKWQFFDNPHYYE
ncbi:phospholipase A2-like [Neocloeon triangulifer]|uniref:phospholipase A2-like n=1 Tax=Neocloeon triangulifer TaxID=2078957 RepID=UPI00286F6EFB|nr:phospholipase A2-like [Neocloeon triangulifer]